MTDSQVVALAFLFWIIAGIGVPYLMMLHHQRRMQSGIRSLLVATSLVALGLGLVAWAAK
jgi:hypothetical protein